MTWLKIVIYYAVALLLGFHVWSTVESRAPETPVTQRIETPFIEYLASRIDQMKIERGDRSVAFQRGDDGRWDVTAPAGLDLPSGIVEAILDTLTTIPPIDVVRAEAGMAGEFGLNPPRTRMRLDGEGELISIVSIGERNPTTTAVYAKKSGDGRVYLLGLNAHYYMDLAFEAVDRVIDAATALRLEEAEDAASVADTPNLLAPEVVGDAASALAAGVQAAVESVVDAATTGAAAIAPAGARAIAPAGAPAIAPAGAPAIAPAGAPAIAPAGATAVPKPAAAEPVPVPTADPSAE